jgi:ABC-type glycerol-3-phosphate transport system substrate-binding protein
MVALTAIVGVTAYAGDQIVSRSDRSDRVTVIYWEKWTGSEGEEMQKVVQAFNRSQDKIFVKYLSISGIDQKTILATAGGNPPDIAGIWESQVFQFADANALTDLSEPEGDTWAKSVALERSLWSSGLPSIEFAVWFSWLNIAAQHSIKRSPRTG